MYLIGIYYLFILVGILGIPIDHGPGMEIESRIIGGVPAPDAFAPHMAGLVIGTHLLLIMCGGSIISEQVVLTAAHCIDNFIQPNGSLLHSFHITIGSNQWNSGGIAHKVTGYRNHPKWDPETIKNDAGVLFLEQKVQFNHKVSSIRLSFDWTDEREDCYVTGWGGMGPSYEGNVVNLQPTPDDLQLLYLPTIPWHQCQKAMAGSSTVYQTMPPVDKDVEICTFHSVGHGMCSGDSGSALVRSATGEQIGIVSWGLPCALGAPDVYTRIYALHPFIIDVMKVYGDNK